MVNPDLLASQGISVHAKVAEFIGDNICIFSPDWHDLFHEVCLKLSTIKPSTCRIDDLLVVNNSISGDLILKRCLSFEGSCLFAS